MSGRAQLYKYRGNRCASCGTTVEDMIKRYGKFSRMFEFHHVNPSKKDGHYERLMRKRLSRAQLDEVDKCVLLCGQCHAIIHAQDIRGTLELSAQIDLRTVKQNIDGWAKFDMLERKFTFVSNQPYLLQPCEVRVGSQASSIMFLVEIESLMVAEAWIDKIAQHQSICVRSLQNKHHFMTIEHTSEDRFKVTQSIGLPLTILEFFPSDQPREVLFFRNGYLLTASGELHTQGELTYNATLIPSAKAAH